MLPEIAVTNQDRMTLATYQSIFIMLSSVVGMVGAPIVKDKLGYPAFGAIFAAVILVCMYLPTLFLKERFSPDDVGQKDDTGVLHTFAQVLGNKPFTIYIVSKLFAQVGFQCMIMVLLYIVPTIFHKPDSFVGLIMGGALVCSIVSFFVIKRLTEKIAKRRIYIWGLILMILLLPSTLLLGRYDLAFTIAIGGKSMVISELVLGFAIFTILGFSVATQAVLMSPMIADCTDLDELQTGKRREAVYFGLHGTVLKFGTAGASLVNGFLFSRFGYKVGDHLGVDLVGPAAAVCILIGLIIFLPYSIDREQEIRIRNELDKKRG